MSFEDAAAELAGAIEADNSPTPVEQAAPAPATPEGESTDSQVQPHHAASQPRDDHGRFIVPGQEEPQAPVVEDTFDDGQFNPDTLPPELQPGWKQLQAAFTRKTQQLAERAGEYEGLDPAQAREALTFVNQLQDPNYLVEFHGELTKALQAQGLTPAQAQAVAAQETGRLSSGEGTSAEPSAALAALREYPELAGVADYMEKLEQTSSTALQRVEDFERRQVEREQLASEQEAIRARQMAMAAEVQRQEHMIVSANAQNPNFTTETTPEMEAEGRISDLDAIYALSGHTDGNLLAASELYQRIINSAASSYFSGKSSAGELPNAGASPAVTQTSEIPTPLDDIEQAHKAAQEYLSGTGITSIG